MISFPPKIPPTRGLSRGASILTLCISVPFTAFIVIQMVAYVVGIIELLCGRPFVPPTLIVLFGLIGFGLGVITALAAGRSRPKRILHHDPLENLPDESLREWLQQPMTPVQPPAVISARSADSGNSIAANIDAG